LLVKKYTGYDEPEKAEEFDRKIQRGDVDFVTTEVIEPEHFIREYEYDDTLDITMPGSEFVSMNVNYMLALAYLGDLEGAQSFGFSQYYTMSPIHTTVFRILAAENLQWTEVREDLDYLIDEGRGRYTQYFLSYFLRDPEYQNRRDELSRAFGYVQMQL
jgi:hypothetical protein